MENGSLMKVENIAECSLWNILQYFWPALSDNWSWKPIFGVLFEWPLQTGFTIYGSPYKILVLITYAKQPPLNINLDVSSRARNLIFGQKLPLLPCFVYARSEDSGKTAHMRRLIRAFAVHQCDKHQNLVYWPNNKFDQPLTWLI